jgi:hypothetical protein
LQQEEELHLDSPSASAFLPYSDSLGRPHRDQFAAGSMAGLYDSKIWAVVEEGNNGCGNSFGIVALHLYHQFAVLELKLSYSSPCRSK